jgi:MFS transporter, FSR family, fosmidomycin resistance protein
MRPTAQLALKYQCERPTAPRMSTQTIAPAKIATPDLIEEGTLFRVLTAISFCHLLNDMVQSLVPSMYPILQASFHLNFTRLGLITLTYQITASLLQPFIGYFTDRKPMPYSLPAGMTFTLVGLLLLAVAPTFALLIIAACLIGVGSAVFHPESSRVARLASGGAHGMAQSFFQVGGNTGSAIGPLLALAIVTPRGQTGAAWFSIAALLGIFVLIRIGHWYKARIAHLHTRPAKDADAREALPRKTVGIAMAVLMVLIFSKYFYLASFSSYYIFYLISKFGLSVRSSQFYLFVFFGAVAAGTLIGGPVGDRVGRKLVIWVSILGVLPFTMLLPYVNLFWTVVLSIIIGFVLASAFSAILVYAQDLVPGRIGMISGLFFGVAFGMGGIGAAVLGKLADLTSVIFVYKVCAYLPALGILTAMLPTLHHQKRPKPL